MFYCIGTSDLVPETAVAINIRLLNHSTIPQSAWLPEFSLNHSVSQAVLPPATIRHPSQWCTRAESPFSPPQNAGRCLREISATRQIVAHDEDSVRVIERDLANVIAITGLLKSLAFSRAQPRIRPLMETAQADEDSTRRRIHDAIRWAQRNDRLFC